MIVEYEDNGMIFHVMNDPVHKTVRDAYAARGGRVLILDPIPGAQVQAITPDGRKVFDDNGDPVMTSGNATYQKADIRTDYVKDGKVVRRPDCPAKLSVAGRKITISDLPSDSTVSAQFEGETVQIEDTSVELDEAGPITIIITPPFPYLEARHDLEIE